MKYSITVLQAEVKRFENGIKAANKGIKHLKEVEKKKDADSNIPDVIKSHMQDIAGCEKLIKELKADIKKL